MSRVWSLALLLCALWGGPARGQTVSFHCLIVEVETTSDWTVVHVGACDVLTSRVDASSAGVAEASSICGRFTLRQSLANARKGARITMRASVALPAPAGDAMPVVIEKGALGETSVRLTARGFDRPLGAVTNIGVAPGDPGRNRREFTVELGGLAGRAPETRDTGGAPVQKMVWAFYYPWYSMKSWESDALNDRPAVRYDSADPGAIRRHIDEAKAAGIDGFICSWWGPRHATDRNLAEILRAAEEKDFKVTIYFETLRDQGGRPEAQILEWLRYFLKTYGGAPALMRVDGKPVVVLWASGSHPALVWRRTVNTLRAEGLDAVYVGMGYDPSLLSVFDGLHEYGIFNIPDAGARQREMGHATRHFGLLSTDAGPTKIWCATVQPGYDERPIPGRRGLFKEREGGAFYRSTWDAALASKPDWVFITTWNEWWEHTAIEPGEEAGDLYLKITGEYARRWKSAD